jgi:hypothetical protein
MAIHYFPLEEGKNPIHFVSDPALFNSAKIAESILAKYSDLVIPKVQCQSSKQPRNAWYVAFDFNHDVRIINLTLTRAGVNVEFRYSQYLDPKYFDEMKWQTKNWRCLDTQSYSMHFIHEVISSYLLVLKNEILNNNIKITGRSFAEDMIYNDLKVVLPDYKIRRNLRHDKMRSDKNEPLEFDLFIKEASLGIEVQGPQHYRKIFSCNQRLKENDQVKIQWCAQNGIKLVWINWEEYNQVLLKAKQAKRIQFYKDLTSHISKTDKHFFDWPEVLTLLK